MLRPILCLAATALTALPAGADNHPTDASSPERPAYVEITVEINGLEESTIAIRDTMAALSNTLIDVADSPDSLSVEQLDALGRLIDKSSALTASLERTVASVPAVVEGVRDPGTAALRDWLSTASVQAIDPTIRLASREVRTWIKGLVLGGVLLLVLIGLGLYVSARELRQMARVLKSLADDYQIVPRKSVDTDASDSARPPARTGPMID